jgi:hypothetical protein
VLLGDSVQEAVGISPTGVLPSPPALPRAFDYPNGFLLPPQRGSAGTTRPTTPRLQPLPGITQTRFSLIRFRSPLLTESRLLSLPAGTEMFHFPACPPRALCVQARVTPHDGCRVPPFGHPRINARLAAPRGLTQPPTSFIGSWCLGIHRAPLPTWPHRTNTQHTQPPPHTPAPTRD